MEGSCIFESVNGKIMGGCVDRKVDGRNVRGWVIVS